ncbi:MAG: phosphoribosylformylglycinamidine synthase subunit PurS, partial [Gemmatimonadota bacterium]|nr:phosphoribosylformylglycinamidine synthase subunit PurS [Gemmatimonadota bacterium]
MIHRIEVGLKPGVTDSLGESVARRVAEDLGLVVQEVRTVEVYTTNIELSSDELVRLAGQLFADPVIQHYSVDRPLNNGDDFDWLLEVGYRPGVTDNVGHTADQGVKDMLGLEPETGTGFFTSRQYLFNGRLERRDVEHIARDLLANDLIERWQILSREQWAAGDRIQATVPVVAGGSTPEVRQYDLEVPDGELVRISEEGTLSLSLEEMQAIQAYYRREEVCDSRQRLGLLPRPTDVELECL